MTTRDEASQTIPKARDLIRQLGAHVVDVGILKQGEDWIIEVGVARSTPRLQEAPPQIEGVRLVIVDYDSPTRDDIRPRIRRFLKSKGYYP